MSYHDVRVTIPVSDIPTELSNYGLDPANALIINNQAQKVWVSHDAGLRSGIGTPLNGFTSMRWGREGRIYAILDEGETQSCELIISPTTSEYQPSPVDVALAIQAKGVPIIADSQPFFVGLFDYNDLPVTLNVPGLDIGKYTSITWLFEANAAIPVLGGDSSFQVDFPSGSTAGHSIEFFDQVLCPSPYDVGSTKLIVNTPIETFYLPPFLSRVTGSGNGSVSVSAAVSTRVISNTFDVTGIVENNSRPRGPDLVLLAINGTLNAGETADFPIAPWNGEVSMKFLAGGGAGNVVFDVLVGRDTSVNGWHYVKVAGAAESLDTLFLPNRQCMLHIDNQGAVANTFFALIVGRGR